MLERVLTEDQESILQQERQVLGDLRALLARLEAEPELQAALRESIAQLDELFLLVVVGEFNAGKSAFINTLLGSKLLNEGVTPTTSEIQVLRWGEKERRVQSEEGLVEIQAPVPLLQEINLVDTPGTNAIQRRHEALTEEFVPRSDLVLFVTSADRPFTESERAFLERLRSWGKKVVVVVNKVDILENEEAVDTVRAFVARGAAELLGFDPQIFTVSARQARLEGGSVGSRGFDALESYIRSRLDETERLRLKLLNPLGVARRAASQQTELLDERLALLAEDVTTIGDLEEQHRLYTEDMGREFKYRLEGVEKLLQQIENRGIAFFDETLRLLRIPDLLNRSRLQLQFERQVIADAPAAIDAEVRDLIDWMVESENRQWQAVVEHVRRRQEAHQGRMLGEVAGTFESSRRRLLDKLGRASQRAIESYDQRAEASRLAQSVQNAVTGTALLEAGAVGLGTLVALAASSTAADITGILAAGTLATLGLFVIPARRKRAKALLREKLSELRARLVEGLSSEFSAEIERSTRRIEETTAPYTRFVRSERERLEGGREELRRSLDALARMEGEVGALLPAD